MPLLYRRNAFRALLIATTAVSLEPFAAAQDDDGGDDELREETVTVYGTSNPLPVFDYPGQVTVIDRGHLLKHRRSLMVPACRAHPGR